MSFKRISVTGSGLPLASFMPLFFLFSHHKPHLGPKPHPLHPCSRAARIRFEGARQTGILWKSRTGKNRPIALLLHFSQLF
jgi:hypothetical protein